MDAGVLQWVLGTGLIAAIGAVGWLARTVIHHTAEIRSMQQRDENGNSAMQVWCLERFVARHDYVPQTTLINSKLDKIVERLDERLPPGRA